jgi:hypothetical protein
MKRDNATFPARQSVFDSSIVLLDGKGNTKTVTLFLSDAQKKMLKTIHQLCHKRVELGVPANVHASENAHEEIQSLDSQIAAFAPEMGDSLKDLLSENPSKVLHGVAAQVQAIWQSYFMSNPITE